MPVRAADELGISAGSDVARFMVSDGEDAVGFSAALQQIFFAQQPSSAGQQGAFPGLLDIAGAGESIQRLVNLIGDDELRRGQFISQMLFGEPEPVDSVSFTLGVLDDRPIIMADGADEYVDEKRVPEFRMGVKRVSGEVKPYAVASSMPFWQGNMRFGSLPVTMGSLFSQAVLYAFANEILNIMSDRRAQVIAEAAATTTTPAPGAAWPTAGTMLAQINTGIAAIRTASGLTTLGRQAFGLLLVNDAVPAARLDGVTSGTGLAARYKAITPQTADSSEEDIRRYLDIGEVKTASVPRLGTLWGSDAWLYIRSSPSSLKPIAIYTYSNGPIPGNLEPYKEGLKTVYPVFRAEQAKANYTGGGLYRIVKPYTGT